MFLHALDILADKCQCSPVGVSADIKNIPDRRITSSSVYRQYYPYQGRLNGQGGWCASTTSNRNDFIQVDMGAVRSVCAVATQGKTTGSYVESYKLLVSTDGVTWNTYKENNADKVCKRSTHTQTRVYPNSRLDARQSSKTYMLRIRK